MGLCSLQSQGLLCSPSVETSRVCSADRAFPSSILQSTVAGRRWERAKTGLQSVSARAFFQGSVQAHISQQSELSHGFPENVFSEDGGSCPAPNYMTRPLVC